MIVALGRFFIVAVGSASEYTCWSVVGDFADHRSGFRRAVTCHHPVKAPIISPGAAYDSSVIVALLLAFAWALVFAVWDAKSLAFAFFTGPWRFLSRAVI